MYHKKVSELATIYTYKILHFIFDITFQTKRDLLIQTGAVAEAELRT